METSSLIIGAAGLILIAILVLVVADDADASVTAPELAGPSVHPARPVKPVKPMCSMRPEDWMY